MTQRRLSTLARSDSSPHEIWSGGLDQELGFWSGFFATRGGEWSDDYSYRLDPASRLQPFLAEELSRLGDRVRLLDVGAGPLTYVGKQWPGHVLEITAVDALADRFADLLEEFHVEPPVRTLKCESEHLSELFPPASFDAAFARNTLDHSYDPLGAIREMLSVVRPGGIVLLMHLPNEAERELYRGLHQWNFDVRGSDCVLWRPGQVWSLSDEVRGLGTVMSVLVEDGWIRTRVLKPTT